MSRRQAGHGGAPEARSGGGQPPGQTRLPAPQVPVPAQPALPPQAGGVVGRRGFTLIEVVASLLVLSLGLFAAIALLMSVRQTADRTRAQTLAMLTARSAFIDPTPLVETAVADDWSVTAGNATGYLNGLYVVRRETTAASLSALRVVDVSVEVFAPGRPEPLLRLAGKQVRSVQP